MELRRYWQILTRYWPVVAALTLVGLLAAYLYYTSNRPTYQAVSQVSIFQQPSPDDAYSGIYANQSSEFAADDFTRIIPGNRFMAVVANQLKEGDINLTPEELKGMVTLERKHRVLTVTTSHPSQNTSLQVARAIASTLENSAAEFVKPRPVTATITDAPVQANLAGGRTVLLAVLRVLAGLLAGVALAFLLAYLDNTIRTRAEAEESLGLPALGQIPPDNGKKKGDGLPSAPPAAGDDPLVSARLNALQAESESDRKPVISR